MVLGPIIDRVALPLLARTTASALSSTRMAVTGAAAGSCMIGAGAAICGGS